MINTEIQIWITKISYSWAINQASLLSDTRMCNSVHSLCPHKARFLTGDRFYHPCHRHRFHHHQRHPHHHPHHQSHPHPHQDSYNPVHGPLSLLVCTVGILFNLLNILVKTFTSHLKLQLQDIVKCAFFLNCSTWKLSPHKSSQITQIKQEQDMVKCAISWTCSTSN